MIMIATGSEVSLAVEAAAKLNAEGKKVRVVSMPSTDVFLNQDETYRESVLPKAVTKRLAIEAATTEGWYRFVGYHGRILGIDRYGVSAPAPQVFKECGLTVEHIINVSNEMLESISVV